MCTLVAIWCTINTCDCLFLLPKSLPVPYTHPLHTHTTTLTQERLHSLKRYVFELKESYDELLRAFSLLETGSKQRVGQLEAELSDKITQTKVKFLW